MHPTPLRQRWKSGIRERGKSWDAPPPAAGQGEMGSRMRICARPPGSEEMEPQRTQRTSRGEPSAHGVSSAILWDGREHPTHRPAQPHHMSMGVEYSVDPSRTSGGRYHSVTTSLEYVLVGTDLALARPGGGGREGCEAAPSCSAASSPGQRLRDGTALCRDALNRVENSHATPAH